MPVKNLDLTAEESVSRLNDKARELLFAAWQAREAHDAARLSQDDSIAKIQAKMDSMSDEEIQRAEFVSHAAQMANCGWWSGNSIAVIKADPSMGLLVGELTDEELNEIIKQDGEDVAVWDTGDAYVRAETEALSAVTECVAKDGADIGDVWDDLKTDDAQWLFGDMDGFKKHLKKAGFVIRRGAIGTP